MRGRPAHIAAADEAGLVCRRSVHPNTLSGPPSHSQRPLAAGITPPENSHQNCVQVRLTTMGTNLNPNMSTRSMFGSQALSARRSAASYGFGSSTREHQAKLFVSQAHSATAGYGLGSPGPATYGLRSSVGRQEDARKASAPSYGFSTNERFTVSQDQDAANAPLGSFLESSFGHQTSSSAASQPKFGFGSAQRSQMERVFVSEEHNKSLFGTHSPGPCSYTLKGARCASGTLALTLCLPRTPLTPTLALTLTAKPDPNQARWASRTCRGSTATARRSRPGHSAAPSVSSTTTSSAP